MAINTSRVALNSDFYSSIKKRSRSVKWNEGNTSTSGNKIVTKLILQLINDLTRCFASEVLYEFHEQINFFQNKISTHKTTIETYYTAEKKKILTFFLIC